MISLGKYIKESITHASIDNVLGKYAGKIFLQTLDKYKKGIFIAHSKNETSLLEGITKTYPSRVVVNMVISKLYEKDFPIPQPLLDTQKELSNEPTLIVPHIHVVLEKEECSESLIDLLKDAFLGGGYTLGANKSMKFNGKIVELLQFEPKFHPDNTEFLGRYLYHATTKKAWDTIQKRGLFPTNKNQKGFVYDGRCFFFTKKEDETIKDYLLKSEKRNNDNGRVTDEFVLLEIDRNELQTTTFYGDPNTPFFSSVFTYENIHPSAIQKFEDIELQR